MLAQYQGRPGTVGPEIQRLVGEPAVYTIGPGDITGIVFYKHSELLSQAGTVGTQFLDTTGISSAPGFIVRADGQVSFPYVGRINVAGLTEVDASDFFEKRLAKVFKNPQVTFRIQSFRSRRA